MRAGVGLEPDRVLLAGVEVGRQDQLGLEQETVLGRDLEPLARAEPQPLQLVRRVGVDRADQPAVRSDRAACGRASRMSDQLDRKSCAVRAHAHVVAAGGLRQPLDRTARLDAVEVRPPSGLSRVPVK